MATMIPDDIQDFTTPGEGAFYRFLQAVAQPDDRHLSWYLPDIQGREPDFILYSDIPRTSVSSSSRSRTGPSTRSSREHPSTSSCS
ncbi:MAG: hypothetical protein AABY92_06025 [Thermodesulfobacteriota bacterium]